MAKIKVELEYQDAANYKSGFDIQIDKSIAKTLTEGQEIEVEKLGLAVEDIPHVRQFGYDYEIDHNIVTIERIHL